MATIQKFEDIKVWQKARGICKEVFTITNSKEFQDDYWFKHQIRSSSGSVMDNITEGFERGGRKEFIQFLGFAKGSSGELRSQLIRAYDQNYIDTKTFERMNKEALEIAKMIMGFIEYLKKSNVKGQKYD
jgi:four helix bundle protein